MAKKASKQNRILTVIFLALFATNLVFAILSFCHITSEFIQNNLGWFILLSVMVFGGLCAVSLYFVLKRKDVLAKALLSVQVLLLFCMVCLFVFLKTNFFEMVETPEKLQAYLEKSGAWMPIFYIILQYLQVILLPIPSVVSTVAGVALFGALETVGYSLIGILLGSITAFFLGRKLGDRAAAWIVGRENLTAWKKKLKGKDNFILTAMFLLPLFPDDVLCFVAGLSTMSAKYFLGMILVTRTIGIVGTCYSFDFIPFNTWWGLLIWGLLIALVIAAFILFYKYMDRIQAWWKKFKKRRKMD